jgi:hypothetical protein
MGNSDAKSQNATEVKACPKCGKRCAVVWSIFTGQFYAVCNDCHMQTPTNPSQEEALRLWNPEVFEGQPPAP